MIFKSQIYFKLINVKYA